MNPSRNAIRKLAAELVARLLMHGGLSLDLLRQCALAMGTLLAAVVVLEDFYRGRLGTGAVYFLIDAHSFFNSSAGKPLLGPLLVVAGGVVGLLTTVINVSGRFFWLEFSIFSISGLLLLWFLIQLSPPVSASVSGLLEIYRISEENNQLGGAVSLCLVTLSAWLSNRLRLRTRHNAGEESENDNV